MSVYDDLKNADLPIDHPDHPFGIERYREMVNAEIAWGRECLVTPGFEAQGQVILGQRWAVGEEENKRIEAEMQAMWARLENLGLKPKASWEGEDVSVR
jgi:hypothetical protein